MDILEERPRCQILGRGWVVHYKHILEAAKAAPAQQSVELEDGSTEQCGDGAAVGTMSRSGAIFDRAAGEQILAAIHVPIANGIRSTWRRVKPKMKAAASDSEEDRIWQEECDRLLFRLNESAFMEAA